MIFKAGDFHTREYLERAITEELGKSTEHKKDSIIGTVEELKRLHLSHGQKVWGVTVKASDPPEPKQKAVIDRGKIIIPTDETLNIDNSIEQ